MAHFRLVTSREYTEVNGDLLFRLRSINVEAVLKKYRFGKWIKINGDKDSRRNLNAGGAVYVISIYNKKNKKEDVAYVGSSKSVHFRLYSHQVLSFFECYLSQCCLVSVYILYTERLRTIEDKLICDLLPFLNSRLPGARSFQLGKNKLRERRYDRKHNKK